MQIILWPALHQARSFLKASGLLIVEDFAISDVHKEAAEWFYRLISLLDACDVLLLARNSWKEAYRRPPSNPSIERTVQRAAPAVRRPCQTFGGWETAIYL
jgi:hypothetical protein